MSHEAPHSFAHVYLITTRLIGWATGRHLPSTMPSGRNRAQFSGKGGAGKRNENNRVYAKPLPVLFQDISPWPLRPLLNLGLSLTKFESPECEAFFDPVTRSVWVINPNDAMILWRRGFFGKGNLSRSEPTWLARQKSQRGKRSFLPSSKYRGF